MDVVGIKPDKKNVSKNDKIVEKNKKELVQQSIFPKRRSNRKKKHLQFEKNMDTETKNISKSSKTFGNYSFSRLLPIASMRQYVNIKRYNLKHPSTQKYNF